MKLIWAKKKNFTFEWKNNEGVIVFKDEVCNFYITNNRELETFGHEHHFIVVPGAENSLSGTKQNHLHGQKCGVYVCD